MEGEAKNFIKVWIIATTSLFYCYYISSRLPKGLSRLISLLPVFYLFIVLPLELTTIHLGGITIFFLTWLATTKLFLFAFDHGPLSASLKVFHFIALACLPIKFKSEPKNARENHKNVKNPSDQTLNLILFTIKFILLVIVFHCHKYKNSMHPYVVVILYCLHIYLELEIALAITIIPARVVFGFELEPQFNEPYLATSLQDFWGHRWNLMVTKILRPTVYFPIRQVSLRLIGPKWASLPAVMATFVVSGLIHETIYFYLTRVSPTWEVTWFFILHGICVAIEIIVKKIVKDKWRINRVISGLLTITFVVVTGTWLFLPQLIRNGVVEKVLGEYSMFIDFLKQNLSAILFF
ncbi:probable long-chain-alcohol O-fatty-acyltransferase 5 [Mercurialis annua]|uniref:probable long-chain-alcohol O-fatty-acyltransferase 5 n=1 Tax=Mercurialis annua TaxID=3986 RepID=UPI00215FE281|nr:probable long-chain-alcohol O-fatty-acyltransferase 5 [Mercurialis annua]